MASNCIFSSLVQFAVAFCSLAVALLQTTGCRLQCNNRSRINRVGGHCMRTSAGFGAWIA